MLVQLVQQGRKEFKVMLVQLALQVQLGLRELLG
jgi:hypothetical protein